MLEVRRSIESHGIGTLNKGNIERVKGRLSMRPKINKEVI